MITADQIVAHLVGDYILQSDYCADRKTSKNLPALVHALTYTLCFIPFVLALDGPKAAIALSVIGGTHFLIDRFRLARYVVYAKNFLAPRYTVIPSDDCDVKSALKATEHDDTVSVEFKRSELGDIDESSLVMKKHWWYNWDECKGTGYHKARPQWLAVWLLIIADNTMHIIINGAVLWAVTNG